MKNLIKSLNRIPGIMMIISTGKVSVVITDVFIVAGLINVDSSGITIMISPRLIPNHAKRYGQPLRELGALKIGNLPERFI